MTIRNLEHLFAPRSVAVIGTSGQASGTCATILRNLRQGRFAGALHAVVPDCTMLEGVRAYPTVSALPEVPDLAVVCAPAAGVAALIGELGACGTGAAIVLTDDLVAGLRGGECGLHAAMLAAARPFLLRVLGPGSIGMQVPGIGLNASATYGAALPGKIALVSQSDALVGGMVDWATSRGIGFSKIVCLGDGADIDFGDMLDYLAHDAATAAVLLYMESVGDARKFMSAARGAARVKPVLVLKSGRGTEASGVDAAQDGAPARIDAVYDAAIRRAGMLRVFTTKDLFRAVETMARARPLRGERLTILGNGRGPARMATDALIVSGGVLAALSQATTARLGAMLPAGRSSANPVDVGGNAPVALHVAALQTVMADPQTDAVLLILAPSAVVPPVELATALLPLLKEAGRTVLACWLGGDAVAPARALFSDAGLPTYGTPEDAIRSFMQMVQFRRNQKLLIEVPSSTAVGAMPEMTGAPPAQEVAQAILGSVSAQGRASLSEPETRRLLDAYSIRVIDTRIAASVPEAVAHAVAIGFPVALKILSPEIRRKSDVGGVSLDLDTADAVAVAATGMCRRLRTLVPEATLQGFSVQPMARRPYSHELVVGISADPVFGPVVVFADGGIAADILDDSAIGLPPLNTVLARDMVSRTRVARLLNNHRNHPAADIDAVCDVLVKVAQLACELPEVGELYINPLLADAQGVIVLDARIGLVQAGSRPAARLAIRPYPQALEQHVQWQGADVLLRPIRPEDAAAHVRFTRSLTAEDIRFRMFIGMRELPAAQLARFTQIDYDREMAFIATRTGVDGRAETLGVARVAADPDNREAEFAIIVRSDLKSRGLGTLLMTKLIDYCRMRGTGAIIGEALIDNAGLRRLAKRFGFEMSSIADSGTRSLRLTLGPAQGPPAMPTPLESKTSANRR